MKKAFRFFALTAVLVSMFAFASCNSTEKKLLGSWKITDIKESGYSEEQVASALETQTTLFTFEKGKAAKVSLEMFGEKLDIDGTYEVSGDTLIMTMTYMGQTNTEKMLIVSLTDKELQTKAADGSTPAITVMTKQ